MMCESELRAEITLLDEEQAQVVVSGYLNEAGSAALGEYVEQQVTPGCHIVVLDLAQVSLASCKGARRLSQLRERLRARGTGVALAGASPVMQSVLDMAGVPCR
jgi:anti-anti-sigma factor